MSNRYFDEIGIVEKIFLIEEMIDEQFDIKKKILGNYWSLTIDDDAKDHREIFKLEVKKMLYASKNCLRYFDFMNSYKIYASAYYDVECFVKISCDSCGQVFFKFQIIITVSKSQTVLTIIDDYLLLHYKGDHIGSYKKIRLILDDTNCYFDKIITNEDNYHFKKKISRKDRCILK